MDWTDFIFGKKPLSQAAQQGQQSGDTSTGTSTANGPQGPSQPANIDIGKMAQGMANNVKNNFTGPQSPYGQIKSMMPTSVPKMGQAGTAPQPTMQQLTGAGGPSASCPTCGAPMANQTQMPDQSGGQLDAQQ
jgi:hypothetical protein